MRQNVRGKWRKWWQKRSAKTRKKRALLKTKILALLFLIFILLVIVAADMDAIPSFIRDIYRFPGGDKLGHFILYGILAFLLARAFPGPARLGRISIPIVIIALLAFAAVEEYTQQFFSLRTSDIVDLTFSFLGILAGAWLSRRKQ
jgi:polysaccharide biosynthesis protein VpsQ